MRAHNSQTISLQKLNFLQFLKFCQFRERFARAQPRVRLHGVRQCIILNEKILFDILIMSVAIKSFEIHVNEINVKISTFKIGGLIFGYVPDVHDSW